MVKTIKVSDEIKDAIEQLKDVFSEMLWEEITEDEDVIGILISGFVDSMDAEEGHEPGPECGDDCDHNH